MYKKILSFLLLSTLILLFFSACPTAAGSNQNKTPGQNNGENNTTKPAEKGVIKGSLKYAGAP